MRTAFLLAAAVAVIAVAVPSATASKVTSSEVAALAAQARTDPAALAKLRAVDTVNGRPVDLAAALDARGPELDARLRDLELAAHGAADAPAVADPRGSARAVLSERRFRGSSVPRPLHRPLAWLGHNLHDFFDAVGRVVPGGLKVFWTVIAAIVAAIAAYTALKLGRRRRGRTVDLRRTRERGQTEDPRRLERQADEAERAGDFEQALRLRFQAGLLRLARSDAIPPRASLTNGEIAQRLGLRSFRLLASDFDEVVYGRREAGGDDVARARDGWPKVLEEAGRR